MDVQQVMNMSVFRILLAIAAIATGAVLVLASVAAGEICRV